MNEYELLKSFLPPILAEIYDIDVILKVIGEELDKLNFNIEDLEKQLFPQTATWGIDLWEEFLGLSNKDKNLELRRALVIAKLSSSNTITKKKFREIIRSYTKDNTADILYYYCKYMFAIQSNVDCNAVGLSELVEEIKPAHLVYFFIFTVFLLRNEEKFEVRDINRLNITNNNKQNLNSTIVRFAVPNINKITASARIEKNLWYLDGRCLLDGARLLNAEKKEEVL